MSECLSREVDCILYGMFNVKKKEEEAKFTFTSSCGLLSCTVVRCRPQSYTVHSSTISVPPPFSVSVHLKVKASFTELRLTCWFFFAILKGEIQSCDRLRNTLLKGEGVATTRSRPLFLLSAQTPRTFFFFLTETPLMCIVTKDENASMSRKKKCFKNSTSP